MARRTGLSADVIRVWERRYGAVAPFRSSANRRLFSDDDVARLALLRRATLAGRPIGHVARLPLADLERLVAADEGARLAAPRGRAAPAAGLGEAEDHLAACLDAVRSLDSGRLRCALHGAAAELGTGPLLEGVVAPLMEAVGEDWRRGVLQVHHEHLATALVRSLLDDILDGRDRSAGGPEILVTTPEGDPHEIGALMVAVVAAMVGWRVAYLGPSLPVVDVAAAAAQRGVRAVALSIVFRAHDARLADDLRELRRRLPARTAILVGGRAAATYAEVLREIDASCPADLAEVKGDLARLGRGSS